MSGPLSALMSVIAKGTVRATKKTRMNKILTNLTCADEALFPRNSPSYIFHFTTIHNTQKETPDTAH